jgi:hypothetical protein
MSRFFALLVYISFTLLGYLPASEGCGESCAMEATCCNSEKGSCGSDEPMDCCVDEAPEFLLYDVVLPLNLHAPIVLIGQPHETLSNLILFTLNLKPLAWHPPPDGEKVYIKFHRLLFYA